MGKSELKLTGLGYKAGDVLCKSLTVGVWGVVLTLSIVRDRWNLR